MTPPPPLPANASPRSSNSRPRLWRVVARGLMFILFAVSIALVTWSLYQFYFTIPPLTRQIRQQDSERSGLATEVQQLEMSWDAAAVEKDPQTEVTIDLVKLEARFAGQTVKIAQRESARDALINGRWDAIGELLDGVPAVKETAKKLPYLAA